MGQLTVEHRSLLLRLLPAAGANEHKLGADRQVVLAGSVYALYLELAAVQQGNSPFVGRAGGHPGGAPAFLKNYPWSASFLVVGLTHIGTTGPPFTLQVVEVMHRAGRAGSEFEAGSAYTRGVVDS